MVETNRERGLSVALVSERMRCDLQEGLPAISSMKKRLEIALDVAKALQYLHAEDLIHRDVKVQNVLVREFMPTMAFFIGDALKSQSVRLCLSVCLSVSAVAVSHQQCAEHINACENRNPFTLVSD